MAALRRTTSDGIASHARKIGPALRLCEAVAILAYFPGETLSGTAARFGPRIRDDGLECTFEILERVQNRVGLRRKELIPRYQARGDDDRPRADRAGARDIARRVSDDGCLASRDAPPQEVSCLLERDPGQHAAVLVLVPERAETEIIPETESPELEHRSALNVPGQEADDHVIPPAQVPQQLFDARVELGAVVVPHLHREVFRVAVQARVPALEDHLVGHPRHPHDFGHALGIGHARETESAYGSRRIVGFLERPRECKLGGDALAEERSVDVEKCATHPDLGPGGTRLSWRPARARTRSDLCSS